MENDKENSLDENNNFVENENSQEIVNIEGKSTNEKKSKKASIIFHIIAIICISLFCAAISPKTLQNDTFYTVTIGEYIYNNGVSDLTTDMYS